MAHHARGRWLAVVLLVGAGCTSNTSSPPASDAGASSPRAAPRTSSQRQAEADAAAALAKGDAHVVMSSGIARFPLTPDYDAETGLPFQDMGCVYDAAYNDAYNGAVRAWIAKHGLPPSSLKPRMLDRPSIERALENGAALDGTAAVQAPGGRRVALLGGSVHLEGGAFTPPFDRPLGLGAGARVRVAWAANGQVLLGIEGPPREGFPGHVQVQVDPGCRCFLQVLR